MARTFPDLQAVLVMQGEGKLALAVVETDYSYKVVNCVNLKFGEALIARITYVTVV
jgi:hypothetical protein